MLSERPEAPPDTLDARGLFCPVPVLRTRERLKTLPPRARLDVVADDPLARLDLRVFCAREGHAYLFEREELGGGWRIALQKAEHANRP
jgi:tRNA 2-thiouridine synthesizing protein A